MRVVETLLKELPLPSSWNKNLFVLDGKYTAGNFRNLLLHAKERSTYVHRGSSRAVFRVQYDGRWTVLKLAMNRAGLAQNRNEAALLFDSSLKDLPILIPGIDYDTENSLPVWIHEEYATPVNDAYLISTLGTDDIGELAHLVRDAAGPADWELDVGSADVDHEELDAFLTNLHILISAVDAPARDAFVTDLSNIGNWGLYEDRLVLVDLGVDDFVVNRFYTRRYPKIPRRVFDDE